MTVIKKYSRVILLLEHLKFGILLTLMVGEGLIVPALFSEIYFSMKRGSEGPKYCEVTAYDFMTFYDFTAYKCTAHDFRPDDFTTYVL